MKRLLLASALLAGCADKAQYPVDHWVSQLRESDADDRAEARDWLVKKGKEAVPVVAKLLGDDDLVVAMSAAEVLGRIGRDAVPSLTETLKSGNTRSRGWAAHALGLIGPDARDAVPALQEAQKDLALKQAATDALGRIRK